MQGKKRIFITGIAGFIGFHLAKELEKRGDVIGGCDNYNSYYDPSLKELRSGQLHCEVAGGDICDDEFLHKEIENFAPTHVVHLAAQAGVRYSLCNPKVYVKSNLEGFVNVLEACKDRDVKLIYASSSSVYGKNSSIPFSEKDRVDSPVSLYGASKRANELIAHSYRDLYGMHLTGLRFFTVYGPWGRPDMAYYKFTEAIERGEVIDVFNQGKCARDFTYIDDIVSGIIGAIDLGAEWELFNLGNNHPESLLDFIEILENLLGKKAKCRMVGMQKGDVVKTYADISHAQKLLGFSPQTSLKEGLEKFINWHRQLSLQASSFRAD